MTNIKNLQGLSIFLVGMMGTGKTTTGKILAQQLDYRFYDIDDLIIDAYAVIEKVSQTNTIESKPTIKEIFTSKGEDYFRELESQVLSQLSACVKSVIATGGGIVLKANNWSYLRDGLVIWLDAPVEVLVQRLQGDDERPLLQETELQDRLELLLDQRRSLYAEADLHIPITKEQSPQEIVADILEKIPTVLKV